MTSNLLETTLKLLRDYPREKWPALAGDLKCSYTWLVQLEKGDIKDPGVIKTEQLYKKLSGKSVEI